MDRNNDSDEEMPIGLDWLRLASLVVCFHTAGLVQLMNQG
jgi:hypothetical protein